MAAHVLPPIAGGLLIVAAFSAIMSTVNALLSRGRRAGILTVSASALTAEHLTKAGVPAGTPIATTEGGREFTRAILGNEMEMDVGAARHDNVEAAARLVSDHPEVGAIVLECTNMVPYAADIREATGLPVFSIETFVAWFHAGLVPRRYG